MQSSAQPDIKTLYYQMFESLATAPSQTELTRDTKQLNHPLSPKSCGPFKQGQGAVQN